MTIVDALSCWSQSMTLKMCYFCTGGHGPNFHAKAHEINTSRVPDHFRPPEASCLGACWVTMSTRANHTLGLLGATARAPC